MLRPMSDESNKGGKSASKGSAGGESKSSAGAKSESKGSAGAKSPDRVLKAKAAETPPKKRNWTAILIGGLVFLALVGSLAAWLQGKASRQPEVDGLTAERDECRDEKSTLEGTVSELEAQLEVLEARRQVARAADELGAQNFGSAQEALSAAADTLRAHGHDAIADRLGEVATTPTDDVAGPRDTILAIGRDLDRAIGH